MEKIISDVKKEIQSARKKFPKFHSGHEAYAVILEEVEELWECIRNDKSNEFQKMKYEESIQIIAMTICYIKEVLKK